MIKRIIGLFLLVSCYAASANETWSLAKGLTLTPPADLDLTFQVIEDYDPEQKIVIGWKGEALFYALAVDQQPGGIEDKIYFEGLEGEYAKTSDSGEVTIVNSGNVETTQGKLIPYKIIAFPENGKLIIMMLSLVKNEKVAYWVITNIGNKDDIVEIANQKIKILKNIDLNY